MQREKWSVRAENFLFFVLQLFKSDGQSCRETKAMSSRGTVCPRSPIKAKPDVQLLGQTLGNTGKCAPAFYLSSHP